MCSLAKTKQYRVQENAKLPQDRPCILGIHPHGKYPMSIFPSFETRPDLFTNFVMAQSSIGKFVPPVGWTAILYGRTIDATKDCISNAIMSGKHVGLMPGGAQEMVHCKPFSKTIWLVKHSGFLKLTFDLSKNNNEGVTDGGNGNTPCVVVPSYVFGLHDSFKNPLSRIDGMLYNSTGMNIPLWLPNMEGVNRGTYMVIGKPIDPCNFANVDDFIHAYYSSLEGLFEANKGGFPGYKDRQLEWVSYKTGGSGKEQNFFRMCFIFTLGFVAIFAWSYVLHGKLYRFSTLEIFEPHNKPTLFVHITACLLWISVSTNLLIYGSDLRGHQVIGYFASFCSVVMCGTAYHLAVTKWIDALEEFNSRNATNCFDTRVVHIAFHCFCNVYTLFLIQMEIGFAIAAARARDRKRHKRYMKIAQRSLILNLIPRVLVQCFQWLFPYSWLDDGITRFTAACIFFWRMQTLSTSKCSNMETRRVVQTFEFSNPLFSVTVLALQWSLDFCTMPTFSILSPIAASCTGAAFYIFNPNDLISTHQKKLK